MTTEIFDVAVLTTGVFPATFDVSEEDFPPKEDLFLREDLWVGRLPHGVKSRKVFEACEPKGLNFAPTRQYGMRYAICRKLGGTPQEYFWCDHDGELERVIFVSRLVRPTSIAFRYSARLYFNANELETIVPSGRDYATRVWIAQETWRDWLCGRELADLRRLLPLYRTAAIPRIKRARKHIDNAFHSPFLDQRSTSLVSSLESLLKIQRYGATKQFCTRVPRLFAQLGEAVTAAQCEAIYDDRSLFVHGGDTSISGAKAEALLDYERFERPLREVLLRASTEPAFEQLFASDDAIKKNFGDI